MQKIEPRCMAVLINADINTGKVVQVDEYVGARSNFAHRDLWSVSEYIVFTRTDKLGRRFTCYYKLAPESRLMRIDGYDPVEDEVSEQERVSS